MIRRVGIVHAVPSLVSVFNQLAAEILPDTYVVHLADEGLLEELRATGQLTGEMARRLAMLAGYAEAYGAEVVMFTCSSLAPLVEAVKKKVRVPVFMVDEAMADRAVEVGSRVGVLATLSTTLVPTSGLVKRRASLKGKGVEVDVVLCEGAFDALGRGDAEAHDRIIRERLEELSERVEVIVMAQASMARALDSLLEAERKVPILTSPRLGVERLKEMLESLDI